MVPHVVKGDLQMELKEASGCRDFLGYLMGGSRIIKDERGGLKSQ